MSVIDTLLGEIEEAIRGAGERRRYALLERATQMLIDHRQDLSDYHLTIFDDVIMSLLGDVETVDRVTLAERLADLSRVPRKVIRRLALDGDLAVAKPIILRSPCLDDETLIVITQEKGSEYVSLIAKRRALSTTVMDHVILRADERVLIEIARNEMTPISESGLRLLAERALSHQKLYRVLRSRPDLATRHIGAIIEAARFRTKANIHMQDTQDDMLSRALAIETARSLATVPEISLSRRRGPIMENRHTVIDLNDLLERDEIEAALTVLASQAGLPQDSVKRAYHAPQHEPLMILLRAQDCPIETALHFMRHKHGSISVELETQMSEAYCNLARDTAKRIASFMSERRDMISDAQNSVEPLRHSA